ncbi:MAG: extracellular solute-binding protein [Candidatus Omnitrophica bacterium]|nr:extracellular solute-binding protein [Candidatus Omnitrophota bacterium]
MKAQNQPQGFFGSAKKLIPLLIFISGSFCLYALSGCSSSKNAESKPTITVWHWMTDRQEAFKELANRYEAKTGVKVDFELYAPSDAYTQKVRAAAQGMNLPDIFGILAEKRDFASFIKAGHVLNLNSYMDADSGKWRNSFFGNALAVNQFSEANTYGVPSGTYGVPIDVMTIQMVYNKDLLKDLGFDPAKPPATFGELLEVGRKIKEKNIPEVQGFVSGWAELWMIDCLANNYAFNIMGKDKVLATIKGEVPYTDPDWVKVFSLFKQMQDSGLLSGGIIAMVNKTAEQLFATGKAVFAFNGSWCVNVYNGMNPNLNYAAMLPPKVSDKFPVSIWGGAGSSLIINARSPRKEEAVKFMEWFTGRDQQAYLSEATHNLPANKESLTKIPEVLSQFADDMDLTTHPNTWGVSEFPAVIETFDQGIQLIILGKKTPEQLAQDVQKVKERELNKRKAQ